MPSWEEELIAGSGGADDWGVSVDGAASAAAGCLSAGVSFSVCISDMTVSVSGVSVTGVRWSDGRKSWFKS